MAEQLHMDSFTDVTEAKTTVRFGTNHQCCPVMPLTESLPHVESLIVLYNFPTTSDKKEENIFLYYKIFCNRW